MTPATPAPLSDLTPGRRRWLEHLEQVGVDNRARGPVGYACMTRGWTAWVARRGIEVLLYPTLCALYRPHPYSYSEDGWETCGEGLTPEGRRMLELARLSAAES